MSINKNLGLDMSKLTPAQKRKMTIERKRARKQEHKEAYHAKREDKYILQAGEAFSNESLANDKFKLSDVKERERERKKYEKEIKTDAINGMFQIKTISDDNLSFKRKFSNLPENMSHLSGYQKSQYSQSRRIHGRDYIVEPNTSYIKDRLRNEFTNLITNNKSVKRVDAKTKKEVSAKLRINEYVSIKYEVRSGKKDEKQYHWFNSKINTLHSVKSIEGIVSGYVDEFMNELETNSEGSEWVFDGIDKVDIKINKGKAIFGGSYIPLPDFVKSKQACVNIKNEDNKCFLWSLIASKHYNDVKKIEVRHYRKFINSFIVPNEASFPVPIEEIEMWENVNDMKINVFQLNEDNQLDIVYNNVMTRNQNIVNLLLINDEFENYHYVWLKNLDRIENSNVKQSCHHSFYRCSQCLNSRFNSQEKLKKHTELCMKQEPCEAVMPTDQQRTMKFINIGREFKHPFHVIADFESTLEKINDECEGNTKVYQKHVPNSFGLKYNCIHNEHSEKAYLFNHSEPEQVIESFVNELERLALKSYKLLQNNKTTIIMTEEQKQQHKQCIKCSKCDCSFSNDNIKVKHHDHINGKFISTLCSKCNLELKYERFLPVYIHNLKGYDAHLFINGLYKYGFQCDKGSNLSCIPNNEERYISFSKKIIVDEYENDNKMKPVWFELRFIDTFAFMATSLESLAGNLKSNCKTVEDMRKVFKNTSEEFTDDEQFLLMTEKGIYPYDYISSYDKLFDNQLPKRNMFYSRLSKTVCDKKDYEKAVNVWNVFKCETFLDYHNIYLKSDVLLLTDIWENFREVCFQNYALDCEYYYTAPGLSFDAMLKETKIELELMTDNNMYCFIEDGIRGGISQISTRHAVANNKYMSNYEKSKEDSYIVYLDANNLYGYAMCEYLPIGNFKWNNEKWTKEKIMSIDDKADVGYTFSVDLHIPDKLHDYMNNYPPCPENISIKKNQLNEWQQKDYHESKIEKLCLTFHDKKNYKIHYRILKLFLSLGVELVKVKGVLEYKQTDFMKQYIMKNTLLRTKAKNDFEKDFYKLMNNSVFGKTMENVRKRVEIRLISNEDQAMRVKNLKRFTIFDDNLVAVHIQKQKVRLNKPMYLGQTILDQSKLLMYNFHYNFMLKKVERENIDLLFTDTDSLCYHIRNQDIFEIMKQNKDLFDLSNYSKDSDMYDGTNNKVIGKFKNESVVPITEFIGLRAKLYTYTVDGETKSHNKCKGVKKNVGDKLSSSNYATTLFTREPYPVEQRGIRSYGHQIYTETQIKTALSCCDDKVYICDNNIKTFNFNHWRIRK